MQRKFRNLFLIFILGISVVVFVLTAVLLVRSYSVDDLFVWQRLQVTNPTAKPPRGDWSWWSLETGRGGFTLHINSRRGAEQVAKSNPDLMWRTLSDPVYGLVDPSIVHFGFAYHHFAKTYLLTFPAWLPLICCALCAWLALRALWKTKQSHAGLCPTCQYDLRAHHPGDKCPECGTPIPPRPPPTPPCATKP